MQLVDKVPGYLVTICFNGQPISFENLGFLNSEVYGKFTISLRRSLANLPFDVSPVYRVSLAKNICTLPKVDGAFSHEVEIKQALETRDLYIKNGSVRFLAYDSQGNICEYEVGVFSQKGRHYAVMMKNWQSQIRYDFQAIPRIENIEWPQLVSYVTTELGLWPTKVSEVPKGQGPEPLRLKNGEGTVLWFKIPSGTGAIQTTKGPAKVHYSDIQTANGGPAYLEQGQRVRIKLIPTEQSNRGVKSDFPFIATKVQLLA